MATDLHYFPPPQLECMQTDDYSAADAARRRLVPKPGLRLFASLTNRRRRTKSTISKNSSSVNDPRDVSASTDELARLLLSTGNGDTIINLDDSAISDFHENGDVYRWAILYENQRGFTLFSTPYYSSLSLLPRDPLPFTIPSTSSNQSDQPEVSLTEYPLPDGTWHWVSKTWMIDMRSDSGEVQYDGFEYNWRFRSEKWTANVGKLSSGGWVRRRRWVRLMKRSARTGAENINTESSSSTTGGSVHSNVVPSEQMRDGPDLELQHVWRGDDIEQDWIRCHMLMKRLSRDGRKLELWKRWLSGYCSEHVQLNLPGKGKRVQKQWTEDSGPLPSEVAWGNNNQLESVVTNSASPVLLEHVAAVLRVHGETLLRSFIYPDSRAQFLELLGHSGLLPQMNIGVGIRWSTSEIDFWSYASGLNTQVDDGHLKAPDSEKAGVIEHIEGLADTPN